MSTIASHTDGMMTKTAIRSFEIKPLGPYSLAESADFIGAWHQAPAEGGPARGHLHLAFLTDERWEPVGACVTENESGAVHCDVYGVADLAAVERQVARILSLDVDGRGWPDVGRRDRVVAGVLQRISRFPPADWSGAHETAAPWGVSSRGSMRQGPAVKKSMCRGLWPEGEGPRQPRWGVPAPS